LKELLKAFLPLWLKNILKDWIGGYAIKSYSQEGEDMILRRIFENEKASFFVDVGAHHPKRFSNTYYFYKRGWSGINIDATPGSMAAFRRARPRDINIEAAVSNNNREVTFFMYNEPALNTFDKALVQRRGHDTYQLIEEKNITTRPLRDVLAEHLPPNTNIKFISIDVEGYDLEVVQSNDWKLYRPEYVLLESTDKYMDEVQSGPLYHYMVQQNYKLFAKTVLTLIFKDGLSSRT